MMVLNSLKTAWKLFTDCLMIFFCIGLTTRSSDSSMVELRSWEDLMLASGDGIPTSIQLRKYTSSLSDYFLIKDSDAHPSDLKKIIFPGQDYNNARVMDFQDVQNWEQN